jgi:hypothetical protein
MYGKYIMTPETREADFKQELIIDRYGTIEYYKKELETHKAERENFPEVSHYYENERTWLEWTYEQLLIIATEHHQINKIMNTIKSFYKVYYCVCQFLARDKHRFRNYFCL